ncbi:MAG: diaminopimelate dehydrogenase [Clostridia bacterium]|nr:diaminopimelate dehydrogenase [Clostridia bacterium]MBR4577729.1 diaminopimelate dehydrogenase [Clostridia bacterium]
MKIGIYGYGNLGRGVEAALRQNPDMEIVGVFTRRDPAAVKTVTGIPVYAASLVEDFAAEIDVMIICGGSASDLPEMTPMLARCFNVVDSFDTHARVPEHFANVEKAAMSTAHTALISAGWDPGLFSLARLYMSTVLPEGRDYTFWGRGVSQGHSDAIRRIPGVKDARQYTVPVPEALEKVRNGENPDLSIRQKHTRECYVVAEEGADREKITAQIREMPNYFADYDTTVTFITEEEMKANHSELPHGGQVIRSGSTGEGGKHKHVMEFSLKLDSNPEFTASVLVACARAVCRMNTREIFGCKTLFDVAPADLSPLTPEEMRKKLL